MMLHSVRGFLARVIGPSIFFMVSPLALAAEGVQKNTAIELGLGMSFMQASDKPASESPPGVDGNYDQVTPHVSAGLYRRISDHWQLGTGVAFDWAGGGSVNDSRSLLSVNMVELVQQWSPLISTRYNFGVARYFRVEPAYQYYFGLAADWHVSDAYFVELEYKHVSPDMDHIPTGDPAYPEYAQYSTIDMLTLSVNKRF